MTTAEWILIGLCCLGMAGALYWRGRLSGLSDSLKLPSPPHVPEPGDAPFTVPTCATCNDSGWEECDGEEVLCTCAKGDQVAMMATWEAMEGDGYDIRGFTKAERKAYLDEVRVMVFGAAGEDLKPGDLVQICEKGRIYKARVEQEPPQCERCHGTGFARDAHGNIFASYTEVVKDIGDVARQEAWEQMQAVLSQDPSVETELRSTGFAEDDLMAKVGDAACLSDDGMLCNAELDPIELRVPGIDFPEKPVEPGQSDAPEAPK